MPTIEKLLNADWKEKLLDKSTVGTGQLKGQLLVGHWLEKFSVEIVGVIFLFFKNLAKLGEKETNKKKHITEVFHNIS